MGPELGCALAQVIAAYLEPDTIKARLSKAECEAKTESTELAGEAEAVSLHQGGKAAEA